MLVSRRTPNDTHCLCPYCGKLFRLDDPVITRDHVIAKSLWRGFRETKSYAKIMSDGRNYPVPEDNPNNLVYSCFSCNRSKSDLFYVPNWSRDGNYGLWGIHDLHTHADYFYEWSKVFIEYFARQAELNFNLKWYYEYCNKQVDKLYIFRAEYTRRVRMNNWLFDS